MRKQALVLSIQLSLAIAAPVASAQEATQDPPPTSPEQVQELETVQVIARFHAIDRGGTGLVRRPRVEGFDVTEIEGYDAATGDFVDTEGEDIAE